MSGAESCVAMHDEITMHRRDPCDHSHEVLDRRVAAAHPWAMAAMESETVPGMSEEELRDSLTSHGLNADGEKQEMAERLTEYLQAIEQPQATQEGAAESGETANDGKRKQGDDEEEEDAVKVRAPAPKRTPFARGREGGEVAWRPRGSQEGRECCSDIFMAVA